MQAGHTSYLGLCLPWADPENSISGGVLTIVLDINVSHIGSYESPSRSNWTRGGSVPELPRKPIACVPHLPLDPPMTPLILDYAYCILQQLSQ